MSAQIAFRLGALSVLMAFLVARWIGMDFFPVAIAMLVTLLTWQGLHRAMRPQDFEIDGARRRSEVRNIDAPGGS